MKEDFLLKNQNKNYYSTFFSLCIIFLLSPFLGLTILYTGLLTKKRTYNYLLYLLCFFCALFIGLINSTKFPENDLAWYFEDYLKAGEYSIFQYILIFGGGTGKEPFFPVLNYIIYFIVGPSTSKYLIILSLLNYLFLNVAILRFCQYIKLPVYQIATLIILMTFTPYIFTMSAQLLRQFLAGSILIFILIERLLYNKKKWILLLLMPLSHATSYLFIPFILISYFSKPLTKYGILIIGVIFILILNLQYISNLLLPLFSHMGPLGYVLSRASTDTTFELPPLTGSKILTICIITLTPLYIIYFKNKKFSKNPAIVHLTNVFLFTGIFVIANLHQAELSVRYSFYIWNFFPFTTGLLLTVIRCKKIMSGFIGYTTIFFFILYLHYGVWSYSADNTFLINTLFHYL